MTKQWFYALDGESKGPFSPEQMQDLLARRVIDGDALVWAGDMPEWKPLSQTELAAAAGAPRAPSPRAGAGAAGGSAPLRIGVGGRSVQVPEGVRQLAPPDFWNAVQTCLQKYADFDGRAARPEFWWFYLFNLIVIFAAAIIDVITAFVIGLGIFQLLAALALFVPMLAAGARRLHDTNRSGWWQLLGFTIIGAPLLIYWLCLKGTDGRNRYDLPNG